MDHLSIVELDARCERVAGRNLDPLDRPAYNRLNLESKVGSAKCIELDQCVAHVLPCSLADRGDLDHIEPVDGALIREINDTLIDELFRMCWYGEVPDDPPRKQVATSAPNFTWVDEGAHDE